MPRSKEVAAPPHAPAQTTLSRAPTQITAEECVRRLLEVADRVERRLISAREGNVLSGIYRTILQHHQKADAPQEKQLPDDVVRELSRTNPQILSKLEPLLTDEQAAMAVREDRDADQ
jgi:hypothetical protein